MTLSIFLVSRYTSELVPESPNTHGWIASQGSVLGSRVYRIDFSSDTSTASLRGPLSFTRDRLSGTGNKNYGWFSTGARSPQSTSSAVDRITFASDTGTASVRGVLNTNERHTMAATGNKNYGWFGGGVISTTEHSTVERITFLADTGTASVRGSLSVARRGLSATGNNEYGWFGGGGGGPSPGFLTRVDRIDFAADTGTAVIRGPLSLNRGELGATGNPDYGWFAGGFGNGSFQSQVDRITFATDTGTASVRGSLSVAKMNMGSVGNNNYGWFAGGTRVFPAGGNTSAVDRITFATDTGTASVRGVLGEVMYNSGSASGAI